MSSDLDSDAELARLRADGDLAALADALGRRGARALDDGAWDDAVALLDEAAVVAEAVGRPAHAAQALIGAATALRGAGRLDVATARAQRAAALAPGGPSRVAALTALGECARGTGDVAAAAAAFAEALAVGRAASLRPFHQAALLRRQGEALRALGRTDEATAALAAAVTAYRAAGADGDEPLRDTLIERAAALVDAPDAAWHEALGAGRAAALAVDDGARLAELAVLEAARAATAGDLLAAIEAAERARQHALDGDAPVTYTAAAIAVADLKERAGDRLGAYTSLAVGWVTLADRIGGETAAAWFRPQLLEARGRWGEADFQAVKAAFEAARAGRSRPSDPR